MPIYDYACSACGRVTEVIHGINDHGPRFCPACGAQGTLRKAMTAPAVVFKGSGWAKVDRRSSSGSRSGRSTKSGSGPSTSAGAGASSGAGSSDGGGSADGGASSGSGTTNASSGGGTTTSSDGGGD